ncbi:hypothetical protein HY480_01590 [Candidatus Uhrbacteria bacterium]|nr:hypothetical protein [Candidatus Uhrbacteria bacterium]
MSITNLQRKEITEVLTRFGLHGNERAVYLTLLGMGGTTVTPLARRVRLPVTTVQSIGNRLVDRGIVGVTKRGSRTVYEAYEPVVLRRLLERQIEEVATIIPYLKALRADVGASPNIRVFPRDRVNDLFLESLACRSKLVYEIVAAKDLQEVIGERLHYTRRRIAAGVHLKSLRVESREIKKYSAATHIRELREAKSLPRELTFQTSIFFWDDTVAFVAPRAEGFAWVVESRAIRVMAHQLFDLLWSISRKMETA